MLIQVDRDTLLEKLQNVGRVVPTRSVNPVLSGVLLVAESDCLEVIANDLEISISASMPCIVQEPGEIVIPARLLTEAVRRSPSESLTLNLLSERNTVQLASGSMQMEILTLSSEEFPERTTFAAEKSYIIPQLMVKNMIRQVYFAISREELRPILTGALWSFTDGQLCMTALDGYRLASRWSPVSGLVDDAKVVVPGKALRELLRLLSDLGDDLSVKVGGSAISFEFNDIHLVSRLLEGQFPRTEQFLPKAHQTRVLLRAEMLISAVERAALVSKEGTEGSVKLVIDGSKLSVSAQSMDIGKHYEEMEVDQSGEDLQIMFNIKALGELLRSAESDEVSIDFHGSFGPAILRPASQQNYFGLLMPLRLN